MFTRSGPSYSSMTMTEPRTIEGTGLSLLIDADTEGVTIRLPHGVKLDGPLATAGAPAGTAQGGGNPGKHRLRTRRPPTAPDHGMVTLTPLTLPVAHSGQASRWNGQ